MSLEDFLKSKKVGSIKEWASKGCDGDITLKLTFQVEITLNFKTLISSKIDSTMDNVINIGDTAFKSEVANLFEEVRDLKILVNKQIPAKDGHQKKQRLQEKALASYGKKNSKHQVNNTSVRLTQLKSRNFYSIEE